jgi:hypothetical protein
LLENSNDIARIERSYKSQTVVCGLYGKRVAHLRVSTQRQQRSGLGIEAQRAAIARFAEAEGLTLIAEFVEAETGKGADALDRRSQLAAAWPQPNLRDAACWCQSSIGSRAMSPSHRA